MAKFLGPTGLTVLWSRIKAWVKNYAYITSSTSGGITTNTITIDSRSVTVPSKTSDLNNDAGFITGADIPEGAAASSATPLMDGTASVGSSNAFARGDHRHPSDTTKADKPTGTVTAGNLASLDANGNLVDSGVSASNAGTDTKNTAGATDSSSKMFVVGATALTANPLTYTQDTVWIGTDGKLHSGVSGTNPTATLITNSTVATASDLSEKVDKVTGGTAGNLVSLDSNGNIVDSGQSASSVLSSIKVDGVSGSTINRYGVCSTAADTVAKTVNVTGGTFNLETGAQVIVNFSNINTANNPTLNVNSTGAKSIYVDGTQITTNEVGVLNGICNLVYDGTKWNLVGKYLVNDIGDYVDSIVERISENCITRSGKTNDEEDFFANAVLTVPYTVGLTTATAPIRIGESAVEMGQDGQILITNETSDITGSPTTKVRINLTQVYAPLADATFSSVSILDGTSTQVLMANGSIKNVGGNNGIASLDSSGKVPTSQLPSYVDDVVEAYIVNGATALSSGWLATGSASGTVITPESGKIYIIMNGNSTYPTNSEYRWSGSTYVQLYDGGCTEMTESEMNIAVMGSDTSTWT